MQSRTSEIAALRKDLAKAEKENARLAAENQRVNESLATAQQENKTLTTKLAAARSSVPPESKNVPGSAVKQRSTGVVLPGTAEAAKKAAFQTKKEQLYGDLTNFLVMGSEMKQNEDGDDVYDCIQTGRNGSESEQYLLSRRNANMSQLYISSSPYLRMALTMRMNSITTRDLMNSATGTSLSFCQTT